MPIFLVSFVQSATVSSTDIFSDATDLLFRFPFLMRLFTDAINFEHHISFEIRLFSDATRFCASDFNLTWSYSVMQPDLCFRFQFVMRLFSDTMSLEQQVLFEVRLFSDATWFAFQISISWSFDATCLMQLQLYIHLMPLVWCNYSSIIIWCHFSDAITVR